MEWPFILTNLNPLYQGCLCQVWLKLAQWFWRRRFLNFVSLFSLFGNYFHLEKGVALHLNKLFSSLSKDALCQFWLKLAQLFPEKMMKMWKIYRQMTGNQKAHKSFQLRWAKNRDLMAHIGIWEALMKNFHLFYARLAVFVFDETLKW